MLIAVIIGAILMSAQWKPGVSITIAEVRLELQDLVRYAIFLLVAIASVVLTRKEHRAANGFTWGPIKEVAILFAGIFVCIVPVMAMLQAGSNGAFRAVLGMVTRGDGSETIVTSGSGANRTHRIVRQTYPQLPSSILPDISAAQLPAGVQPQYTITSGNGYRVVQVTWSY